MRYVIIGRYIIRTYCIPSLNCKEMAPSHVPATTFLIDHAASSQRWRWALCDSEALPRLLAIDPARGTRLVPQNYGAQNDSACRVQAQHDAPG